MAISYLRNKSWSEITREERFFCAELYFHAAKNPAGFAAWLIRRTELPVSPAGEWDLGYEVCLYRDLLWEKGERVRETEYPAKRTFDLCLFGEASVIIIEAKVFEGFQSKQNQSILEDRNSVSKLLRIERKQIQIIGLASSRYFSNLEKRPASPALEPFDRTISWSDLQHFADSPHFRRADGLYKKEPIERTAVSGGS